MPHPRILTLTDADRAELCALRDHDPTPALRERAGALLKIADGATAHAVARHGLLKTRDPDTVYAWIGWYETEGVAGLRGHSHGGPHRSRLRPDGGADRSPPGGAARAG
jgi:Helix-turn-helix domain